MALPLPRRDLRPPRRRLGPDLPAPRERDRAVGGRVRRRAVRAPLAALGHGELRRREDVEVAGQRGHHPPRRRDARSGGAAPADDQRALPQPGVVRDRARRRGAARPSRISTRPRRGSSTSIARSSGWPSRRCRRPARRARCCRRPTRRWPSFREAMDDDFNTAAALGHLYESFVLANKLLDDPKAAAKDVRRRTLARLRADLLAVRRDAGHLPAHAVGVPAGAARRASACAATSTPARGRGAHRRARRRPRRQGLRARRRDPQGAAGDAASS